MIIYLAGGITGNLRAEFKMKAYLAGTYSRDFILKDMKVYIAGDDGKKTILKKMNLDKDFFENGETNALAKINILESYYYLRKNEEFMLLTDKLNSFLLDSGAFTFMTGSNKDEINWDNYVEEYASFINKYDIKLFFELDIDSIVGIDEVERLRNKLETLTKKKCIPVWHKNRGKDYFVKMCKEYPYVAIGGIVTQEIPRLKYEKLFPWFIKTAHQNGAKIHGLGYTTISNLHKYHFDSVDSTAWLYGNRGGFVYRLNPIKGIMEKYKKDGRLKSKDGAIHNFIEWVKFSVYAEKKL